MHAQEAMIHVDSLGLCIMYEPNTVTAPRADGITVGISYDFADYPVLQPGQRRITPVLVCMPHKTMFSSLLSISCPLLCTPQPGMKIKVMYSNTDVIESACWKEAHDVPWFLHPNKASFYLSHFCSYCLVEVSPEPPIFSLRWLKNVLLNFREMIMRFLWEEWRYRVVSIYLR